MDMEIFTRRHSRRAYQDRAVSPEVLMSIMEAARWAPSCFNNQPWRFVAVSRQEHPHAFEAMAGALAGANAWARRAPVLIAVTADPESDYTRKDDPVAYHLFDCGLAVQNLLLAATALGLMGHPMAGYSAPDVKGALDIPEAFHVVCVVSLGYEGDAASLDEKTREKDARPRERLPVEDILHLGGFRAE